MRGRHTPNQSHKASKGRQRRLAGEIIATLAELYPQTFFVFEGRRRPLKRNIDHDLALATTDAITVDKIKAALRVYAGNGAYLRACREGALRIGLDGKPAGIVTAEEAAYAREKLAARKPYPPKTPYAVTPAAPKPRGDGLAAMRAAWRARETSQGRP
jgi:ProP effector